MRKHKIIDHLDHYYKIQNAPFKEDDHQTLVILNNYEKVIFSVDTLDEDAIIKCKKLDQIIHQYLNDNDYRNLMLKQLKIYEINEATELARFLEDVLRFDQNYQLEFYNTRVGSWI